MLKVRTLFSGIGSPEIALRDLQIPFELIDFCEVDKYAVQSYCAVHGVSKEKNLGDITKVWGRNLPYADLMIWGFPCTDISIAGKQLGIVEGETRSGLYYEGLRILRETKPKYSIIENVKNLTGKKFKAEFEQMLKDIEELGYNNYWKVLNAKDYGIPQNRERVFIVSIREDIDSHIFKFPKGFDNGLRLKDFLENEVDEKYYISQEKTEKLIKQLVIGKVKNMNTNPSGRGMNGNVINSEIANTLTTNKGEGPKYCIPCIPPDRIEKRQNGRRFKEDGDPMFTLTSQDRHGILQVGNIVDTGNFENPQRGRIYSPEGISPAINTVGGGGLEPKILRYERTEYGKEIRKQYETGEIKEKIGNMRELRPREDGISNTLTTVQKDNLLIDIQYRIRKLTPKECWRLMGFSDEDFEKAKNALNKAFYKDKDKSSSQLYKQAGNSIVTNCMLYIFKNLLQAEITAIYEEEKELS